MLVKIITSNQYNLQFNRITTTVEVIGACVIVGLVVATVAYSAYACKSPVEVAVEGKDNARHINIKDITKEKLNKGTGGNWYTVKISDDEFESLVPDKLDPKVEMKVYQHCFNTHPKNSVSKIVINTAGHLSYTVYSDIPGIISEEVILAK